MFKAEDFSEEGDYYLLKEPQGSKKWLDSRPAYSSSEIAYKLGVAKKPDFQQSEEQRQLNFAIGHEGEAVLKKWFIKRHGDSIEDLSLAIPKWDLEIGYSPDFVSKKDKNGTRAFIGECKTTKHLRALIHLGTEDRKGKEVKEYIYPAHYYQMLTGMKVIGADKCHYLVFAYLDNLFFSTVVPFNQKDWEFLYSKKKEMDAKKSKDLQGPIKIKET